MPRSIAFLRGINVGGHRVRMETLRDAFVDLGFTGVRTFIASGNVIFDGTRASPATLERRIETHLAQRLGYAVPTFLRSPAELRDVIEHEAFAPADVAAAHAVYVMFLRERVSDEVTRAVATLETPNDAFHVRGREIYWLCRSRLTESLVPASAFGRALGKPPTTMRNMTMLKKLAATM